MATKNFAAILPSPKAPLEVHEIPVHTPGPNELLVRNELIAFNPVEYKLARLAIATLRYPAILGSTFTGTICSIGRDVKDWKIGEKVVVSKKFGTEGNQYGAFQRFVVVKDRMISRVPEGVDGGKVASLMMNLTCVVGLFTGILGLERPGFGKKGEGKVLIYGGSSSFGGLATQFLIQAGYEVVTTSSPKNRDFVEKLGAEKIIDHTLDVGTITKDFIAAGPYRAVVDMISLPSTMPITGKVLSAQGGGRLYVMQPAMGEKVLPDGVEWVFEPWSDCLYLDENEEVLRWTVEEYVPFGIERGWITPLLVEKIKGGLKGVDEALEKLGKGVSGGKLVADPWE